MAERPYAWHELSGSAQKAVTEISSMLADGFTGSVELTCAQGGVRVFKVSRTLSSSEVGKGEGGRKQGG